MRLSPGNGMQLMHRMRTDFFSRCEVPLHLQQHLCAGTPHPSAAASCAALMRPGRPAAWLHSRCKHFVHTYMSRSRPMEESKQCACRQTSARTSCTAKNDLRTYNALSICTCMTCQQTTCPQALRCCRWLQGLLPTLAAMLTVQALPGAAKTLLLLRMRRPLRVHAAALQQGTAQCTHAIAQRRRPLFLRREGGVCMQLLACSALSCSRLASHSPGRASRRLMRSHNASSSCAADSCSLQACRSIETDAQSRRSRVNICADGIACAVRILGYEGSPKEAALGAIAMKRQNAGTRPRDLLHLCCC
jgi:hypothetical protein